MHPFRTPSALAATLLALGLLQTATAAELVVYSSRNEQLIKPAFDAYTAKTGTTIRFVSDKEGALIERLKAEGDKTPADLLITVDAGNLWQAASEGVLAKIDSPALTANVPAHLRDPDGRWYGLTIRARTIVYNPQTVKPAQLSSYEDLADPKWKGKLCLRTSKKVYNQSLVATMIARLGAEKTEQVVKGWVANLATDPFSSDNQAIEAVAAGQCDVTIVNTYYFANLKTKNPALSAELFWANQGSSGVHVNVSGAGVTRHAPHRAEAQRFLEWLSGDEAQTLFANLNFEFPTKAGIAAAALPLSWGPFKQDDVNLAEAGRLQAEAVKLMDRAGYR